MRRCSDQGNKLRYIITIRGMSRDIAINERKLTISRSKSSRLFNKNGGTDIFDSNKIFSQVTLSVLAMKAREIVEF